LRIHDVFGERQGVGSATAVKETKRGLQIREVVEERGGVGSVGVGGEPGEQLNKKVFWFKNN
jgi:hypothetical protein